jgi:hemolysin activation/secretion protein
MNLRNCRRLKNPLFATHYQTNNFPGEARASNGKIGFQKMRRYSNGYQMGKLGQFFRWLLNVSYLKPLKPGLQMRNRVTKGHGGTQKGIKWENQGHFFQFF